MIPLGVLASSYVAPAGGGVTFVDGASPGYSPGATFTLSAMSLGAESSDRVIIAGISHRMPNTAPSSVTIGGVAATLDTPGTGDGVNISIARAAVPTGTTGDVSLSFASGPQNCFVALWSITGYSVSLSDYGHAAEQTYTITPANPGVIIAVSHIVSDGATCAWTGITEDYEWDAPAASLGTSGGHVLTASSSDVTVSTSWTAGTYPRTAAVAYSLT